MEVTTPGIEKIVGIIVTVTSSVGAIVWKAVDHYHKRWLDMEKKTDIAMKAFEVNKSCQSLCLRDCNTKMGRQDLRITHIENRLERLNEKITRLSFKEESTTVIPNGLLNTDSTRTGRIQKIVEQQVEAKIATETQKLEWEKVNNTSHDLERQIKALENNR